MERKFHDLLNDYLIYWSVAEVKTALVYLEAFVLSLEENLVLQVPKKREKNAKNVYVCVYQTLTRAAT